MCTTTRYKLKKFEYINNSLSPGEFRYYNKSQCLCLIYYVYKY